jgi:hypothetical protein
MNQEKLPDQPGNDDQENQDEFVSDTQKVVRRHLENEDDVISEEDIRNVRIGMTPPGALSAEEAEERAKELTEDADKKEETEAGDEPITPWDLTT